METLNSHAAVGVTDTTQNTQCHSSADSEYFPQRYPRRGRNVAAYRCIYTTSKHERTTSGIQGAMGLDKRKARVWVEHEPLGVGHHIRKD